MTAHETHAKASDGLTCRSQASAQSATDARGQWFHPSPLSSRFSSVALLRGSARMPALPSRPPSQPQQMPRAATESSKSTQSHMSTRPF
eukprot:2509135-Pleurochrysis_carterae.AAC.1